MNFPSSAKRCPTQNRKHHRRKNLHHHTTSRRKHPRSRAICCRRARGNDCRSGSDGTIIQRDCEQHHGELRKWSCEHNRSTVLPARDWVCQFIIIYRNVNHSVDELDMETSDTKKNTAQKCHHHQNQWHTCPSGPYWPGCRSERGKMPEVLPQHDISAVASGEQAPAGLNSSRQTPTRRVVPPVPVVLVAVLLTKHAHPLVMTAMNRGPWQRSMRSLRKSLLASRRCGTLSTRRTLWTSTMNTDGQLNSRRCGTMSMKTSTSTSTTTVRNRSVDMFCSTNRC